MNDSKDLSTWVISESIFIVQLVDCILLVYFIVLIALFSYKGIRSHCDRVAALPIS